MESHESCLAADGRAWKVDGRAQALVGPGLATPLYLTTYPTTQLGLSNNIDITILSSITIMIVLMHFNCIFWWFWVGCEAIPYANIEVSA